MEFCWTYWTIICHLCWLFMVFHLKGQYHATWWAGYSKYWIIEFGPRWTKFKFMRESEVLDLSLTMTWGGRRSNAGTPLSVLTDKKQNWALWRERHKEMYLDVSVHETWSLIRTSGKYSSDCAFAAYLLSHKRERMAEVSWRISEWDLERQSLQFATISWYLGVYLFSSSIY